MNAQQAGALKSANQRRTLLCAFKEQIRLSGRRSGALQMADMILAPTDPLSSLRAFAALKSVNGLGEVKVAEILKAASVQSPTLRVAHLTDRQRTVIADELRMWAERQSEPA